MNLWLHSYRIPPFALHRCEKWLIVWCKDQNFKVLQTKRQKALNRGDEYGAEFKVEMKNTLKVSVIKLKGKYNHLEPST